MSKFVGGKEASALIGVHQRTLYQWDANGKIETIRTPGNKRLYNVSKFLKEKRCVDVDNYDECIKKIDESKNKIKLGYVRVSSIGQKDDLVRQKQNITKYFPDHIILEDIGSGMNFKRRSFKKIIDLAIEGKIEELVVLHKDRLTRFGFDLVEDLITRYSSGKIIIVNTKVDIEPEEELVKDVLQVMNVFVAKMNGRRKYKIKKRNKKEN